MKIKSIPENPTITLELLKEMIDAYEYFIKKMEEDTTPMEFIKNASAASAYASVLINLGVDIDLGDQA